MKDPFSDRRTGEFRGDRRRGGWREFRRQYPGFIATLAIAFAAMLAINASVIYKRSAYAREIARLRASMTDAERQKTDLIVEAEENKIRVAIELARRQARVDKRLHLSVAVDSMTMYLEREGAILREMLAFVGPEKTIGTPPDTVRLALPRGERTVQRILDGGGWDVPEWVYTDRGLPPASGTIPGALGDVALVLDGGTVIYSMPTRGPLADSAYVLPGSVRVSADDLKAIQPNLSPGMKVYFY